MGESFILGLSTRPIELLVATLTDKSYATLFQAQPELVQIMGTQLEKAPAIAVWLYGFSGASESPGRAHEAHGACAGALLEGLGSWGVVLSSA